MSSSAEPATAARAQALDPIQGPSGMFENHLRTLNDSYLSFFQERKRIEEQYVLALLRLHKKCRSVDAFIDDHIEVGTMRVAWGEITDNVEREAGTHRAISESLGIHVIEPLSTFKEEQERIRKRVRENIKDAVAAHGDYAENVLPRLKRTYIRKCQEAEEYKTGTTVPPTNVQTPTSPQDPHQNMPPLSKPQSNPANGTRPVVTGPQPLRPLDRRPSMNAHRNRSPSGATSTALQDLAHQGKKQLNQLMTFLDRDGGRSDNALRQVRAKRDADDADREYRKGVHFLETLRIRRIKTVESALTSLEAFVRESSEVVKKVLEIYTDTLTGTAATQKQLCEHARRMVDKIIPQRDSAAIAAQTSRWIAGATPNPVHYYNYNVGECKDLVFGVSLVDYATSRGVVDGDIPKIVRVCLEEIDRRGLDTEGIYRVSGRHAAVLELQHKIERNEGAFVFNLNTDDIQTVSSLLKMYLRELPEPVFKFPLQDRIQHTEGYDEHYASNFALLRSKIRRLPAIHQATLKAIVEHLSRVTSHTDKNKMDSKNLAIVFGSVIFGEDEMPKGGDLLGMQSWKDTLMEDLINNAHTLFQQSESDSPPRPSAPLAEGSPNTYGMNTKGNRTSMPPPPIPTSPRKHHQKSASITAVRSSLDAPRPVPQDFTPDLPPRPANSIHPSLRAGPHASPARHSPAIRAGQFFDDEIRVTPQTSMSSQDDPDNSSSTSLPPPLPPRDEDKPLPPSAPASVSESSTFAPSLDSTNLSTMAEPQTQEPSSKRSSRQIPNAPSELPDQFGDGSYSDVFSPPSPTRGQTAEAGIHLSSTASAAAFASATPSPISSSSSGQSSPSKKSGHGHGRRGSD